MSAYVAIAEIKIIIDDMNAGEFDALEAINRIEAVLDKISDGTDHEPR